ncbi:hypothetical protein BRD00_12855 [Halobacteriales archaeon QS_8_69_26]|nr:MAG: hypothetical protein BRD00_12855 [Halobacteriales archaeon QS_8_69_26]
MTDEHDTPRDGADEGGGSSGSDQGEVEPVGSVPGIDEDASVQLAVAGVATVDELVAADPADLAGRTDFPESTIREWIDAAGPESPGTDDGPGQRGPGTADPDPGSPGDSHGGGAEAVADSDAGDRPDADPATREASDAGRGPESPGATGAGASSGDPDVHPEADADQHPEADPDPHPEADPDPRGTPGSDGDARTGSRGGPDVTSVDEATSGGGTARGEEEVTVSREDQPDADPTGEDDRVSEDELEREILGIDDVAEEGEVYCHDCGATLSGNDDLCPECGARQTGTGGTESAARQTGTGATESTSGGAVVREEPRGGDDETNPMVAGGLSLVIPGAGQAYNGEYKRGAVPFGVFLLALGIDFVAALLLFFFLGGLFGFLLWLLVVGVIHLVIHGGAVYDAYNGASGR